MASARAKAEQAQAAAVKSQSDAEKARIKARDYDPNFLQPGLDIMKKEQQLQQQQLQKQPPAMGNHVAAGGYNQPPQTSQHDANPITQSQQPMANHVPPSSSAISGSKSLLSRVGLGGDTAAKTPADAFGPGGGGRQPPSFLASALAGAAVESALIGGGGPMAAVAQQQQQKTGSSSKPTMASNRTATDGDSRANGRLPNAMTSSSSSSKAGKTGSPSSGADAEDHANRFSQLLSPNVIDDHFDQYVVASSPLGATPYDRRGGPPSLNTYSGADRLPSANNDAAMPSFSYDNPDRGDQSGQLVSPENAPDHRARPLQRRKTLPSGHAQLLIATAAAAAAAAVSMNNQPVNNNQPPSNSTSGGAGILGAVLRRSHNNPATALVPVAAAPSTTRRLAGIGGGGGGGYGQLPARPAVPSSTFGLAWPKAGPDMGSMPDVSQCAAAVASGPRPAMTREEVHVLSQRRREELRRLREEAERRHQQDIVLRLGDVKEWCQERQLLVLVIVLNISLATMFFNLLTH